MKSSYLTTTRKERLKHLLGSALGAWFIYACSVSICYRGLVTAYEEAQIVLPTLHQQPLFPLDPKKVSRDELQQRRLTIFTFLRELGLLEEGDTAKVLEEPRWSEVARALDLSNVAGLAPPPLTDGTDLDGTDFGSILLAAHLATAKADDPGGDNNGKGLDSAQYRADTARALARVLAGIPGAKTTYEKSLGRSEYKLQDVKDCSEAIGLFFSSAFQFAGDPTIRGEVMVSLLYAQVGDVTSEKILGDPTSEKFQAAAILASLTATLIDALHADDGVKRARTSLSIFRGLEQFVLWWILLSIGFMLWSRRKSRLMQEKEFSILDDELKSLREGQRPKRSERRTLADSVLNKLKDANRSRESGLPALESSLSCYLLNMVHRELKPNGKQTDIGLLDRAVERLKSFDSISRWRLTWASRALPAVGFIGTVRGISGALANADSIVRQTSTEGQAAAITDVAGTLGLAFSTTFIALVFGLFTSFYIDRQAAKERALLEKLEAALAPFLDVAQVAGDLGEAPPGEDEEGGS